MLFCEWKGCNEEVRQADGGDKVPGVGYVCGLHVEAARAAAEEAEAAPGPCVACGVQCDADGICHCCAQAEKIDDALAAFDDNDDETRLVDLLTAAMHFARRGGAAIRWDRALVVARAHFNAERISRDAPFSDEDCAAIKAADEARPVVKP